MSQLDYDFIFGNIFLLMAVVVGLFNPVLMVYPLGFIFLKLTLDVLRKLDKLLEQSKES
ncbi:hypothetical protein VPBG_00173 [Vibrio phage helene 12B3]|uniref:hypothetical protein n=1 Tax=Vibrio phage helene 12B3 TaxID=573173 RepID=UPI0002C0AE0C|nr:hypothetical protein VPBG_00173 [Vibrio phage helene 12B3]AGG57945.1 hypothetical protein VPBG_00173 [Vibrio phage helene 12B3]